MGARAAGIMQLERGEEREGLKTVTAIDLLRALKSPQSWQNVDDSDLQADCPTPSLPPFLLSFMAVSPPHDDYGASV